ncbi:MAG: diguanylate cyclase [Desulfamplus sp.]|nr:diguanylate cyclase [Desulfamplus sp.]
MITKEQDDYLSDLNEELFGKINTLTVELEIARLEFTQIFDAVSDPLWVIDNEYAVIHINRSFLKLLKIHSKTSVLGKKCYEILNYGLCQTDNCPLKFIKQNNQSAEFDIELDITKGDKSSFLLTASHFSGLAGETIGVVIQYKDISKRKQYERDLQTANKQLEELVRIDGLTQIANRRFFDEVLQKEWLRMQRSRKPIALIMIDIDFFKLYNDNYGHAKGDDCLKKVAALIKSCMHRSHDLAARYGGEEFVCVLPESDHTGAATVANSILNAIRDSKIPHEYSKIADHITVSIGCYCMIPDRNHNAETIIVKADSLLYNSKESGRNKFTINNS